MLHTSLSAEVRLLHKTSVQWTNNVHATNQRNLFDEGNDWNTDPDLIINTPTVEVGFENREHRIIIQRPNFYSRGDVLSYAIASSDVESAFGSQPYYYVLNATPTQFEVTTEIRHDARFRRFAVDTRLTGAQQLSSPVRSGIHRKTTTYGTRDVDNPISGGFNLADVVVGTTSNASSEIVRTRNNEAEIVKMYRRYAIRLLRIDSLLAKESKFKVLVLTTVSPPFKPLPSRVITLTKVGFM